MTGWAWRHWDLDYVCSKGFKDIWFNVSLVDDAEATHELDGKALDTLVNDM